MVGIGTSIVDAIDSPQVDLLLLGTTRIYGDWKVGLGLTDGNFSVGDRLYADEDGILQNNSALVFLVNRLGEIEYIDENGNVGTFL